MAMIKRTGPDILDDGQLDDAVINLGLAEKKARTDGDTATADTYAGLRQQAENERARRREQGAG